MLLMIHHHAEWLPKSSRLIPNTQQYMHQSAKTLSLSLFTLLALKSINLSFDEFPFPLPRLFTPRFLSEGLPPRPKLHTAPLNPIIFRRTVTKPLINLLLKCRRIAIRIGIYSGFIPCWEIGHDALELLEGEGVAGLWCAWGRRRRLVGRCYGC